MNNKTNQTNSDKLPINRWLLTFNPVLEGEYMQWLGDEQIARLRISQLIGAFLALCCAAFDFAFGDALGAFSPFAHLLVALPLTVVLFASTYLRQGRQYLKYSTLLCAAILPIAQLVAFWQAPVTPFSLTTHAVYLALTFVYVAVVLTLHFLPIVIVNAIVYLALALRLYSYSSLTADWRTAILFGLLAFWGIAAISSYYRIYGDKKLYYTLKGQSRFADKVNPMTKNDPVIKRVESPINKMYQAISDVIWFITVDGDVAYVSPSVKEFMGYEPEELIGKRAITLMTPEQYRVFESKLTRLYKDKNIIQDVFSFKTKAGLLKTGETHVRAYTDNERGDGYVGTTRPISEQKAKEKATSEKKLKELTDENGSLKNDLHNLTEELNTLTEKLTVVNRELAASDKVGKETFAAALGDLLDNWQKKQQVLLKSHDDSIAQLQKKFNDKTMGKHDLKHFLGSAQDIIRLQRNNIAFAESCFAIYNAMLLNKNEVETFNVQKLFESVVLELKQAFSHSDYVVNIDCKSDLVLDADKRALIALMRYLILKSLTQSLELEKRGTIDVKAYRVADELIVEYSDSGKGVDDDDIERFFLQCLGKSGCDVKEAVHLLDYYVACGLSGMISKFTEEDKGIVSITLPSNKVMEDSK